MCALVELSAQKSAFVNEIASSRGYGDYSIEVKSGSMKGDGYLGIINTIRIVDNTNPSRTLNLIIKSAETNDNLRKRSPVRKAYEREMYMYKTIFVEFEKFQSLQTKLTNRFVETPIFYGSLMSEKEESIVLEDLRPIDYRLWNRKQPMDENHISLVMKTYGKLHGVALAMKQKQPEKYQELAGNMKHIFANDDGARDANFLETMKLVFENGFRAVKNNARAVQGLQNFIENAKELFERVAEHNKFTCFVHGDCWCNNMLFTYKNPFEPKLPTHMRFIDFQISHAASPIVDLSYYFYASSSKQVLRKLDHFLKIYHASLSELLEGCDCNPDDVMTFEELQQQWKLNSLYGLFMAMFVMKVQLGESEEAPDLSELANSGKDLLQSISMAASSNIEAVDKRVYDIVEFMIERDFL